MKKRFVEYVQTTSSTTFSETLFGDIPLAIQLVNETGKTLFANRLFLEYFNFSSIEACTYVNVLGRHTPESYAAQLERERVRNPDEIDQTYSISIYSKNNKIRHLSVIRFMKLLDNERTTILVYIDITKSKAKNDALAINERQSRKLFLHSPTATLLIDQFTDRLVDMNHAAEKLFNSPPDRQKKDGWQASESLTPFLANWRQWGLGTATEPIKMVLSLNNRLTDLTITTKTFRVKTQILLAVYMTDVTAPTPDKSPPTSEQQSCQANEALLKMRKALVDNVSHEIRTPMNRIMGFSSLLNDAAITDEERTFYFNEVMEGSNQLLTIINNLIKVSDIEAGLTSLEYQAVDMNELIETICAQVKPEADKKGLNVTVTISRRIKTPWITDYDKIITILINLLCNAIKCISLKKVDSLNLSHTSRNNRLTLYQCNGWANEIILKSI